MNYKNILIIKLSAIGDVIHALPVASALKKNNPNTKITWIVEKPAHDLLTNNPYIDEIIIFDKKQYKSLIGLFMNGSKLARELQSRKFDLVLDLQGLFKSAAIALLSGGKARFVYCNARELSSLISKRVCGPNSEGHVVDRYLDVVRHIGGTVNQPHFEVNYTAEEVQNTKAIAVSAGINLVKPYAVLAPGTNWPNKCWPTTCFAELGDMLFDDGVIPVVIGGPKDAKLYKEIAGNMKTPPINLVGKTSLKELSYIIKQSRVFIGGDTGPMHLAAAVGTPVIALFGPTDPQRNGPYGDKYKVILTPRECRGCWKRKCHKNIDCLAGISPTVVYTEFCKMMKKYQTNHSVMGDSRLHE